MVSASVNFEHDRLCVFLNLNNNKYLAKVLNFSSARDKYLGSVMAGLYFVLCCFLIVFD